MMSCENPQARSSAYSAVNAHVKGDNWWLPRADKVPEIGSPEYLRQIGCSSHMTPQERIEFLYAKHLQHQLHGYE